MSDNRLKTGSSSMPFTHLGIILLYRSKASVWCFQSNPVTKHKIGVIRKLIGGEIPVKITEYHIVGGGPNISRRKDLAKPDAVGLTKLLETGRGDQHEFFRWGSFVARLRSARFARPWNAPRLRRFPVAKYQ